MIGVYTSLLVRYLSKEYRHKWDAPPRNMKELYEFAGKFTYTEHPSKRGWIKILGDWEKKNIVATKLRIKDKNGNYWVVPCHKRIVWHLDKIFNEYVAKGYDKIYPVTQLGCFVPRHKLQDPSKSLSIHSWGLAVDINWKINKVGTRGTMPLDVVSLFKQYGFNWGGVWTHPKDPMHFQFYKS